MNELSNFLMIVFGMPFIMVTLLDWFIKNYYETIQIETDDLHKTSMTICAILGLIGIIIKSIAYIHGI